MAVMFQEIRLMSWGYQPKPLFSPLSHFFDFLHCLSALKWQQKIMLCGKCLILALCFFGCFRVANEALLGFLDGCSTRIDVTSNRKELSFFVTRESPLALSVAIPHDSHTAIVVFRCLVGFGCAQGPPPPPFPPEIWRASVHGRQGCVSRRVIT